MNNEVLKDLSYGVYVVSTMNDNKPTGCIANSIMQVSYDTIAVSINHQNYTHQCMEKCGKFAVSILGENVNDDIIPVFGFETGKTVDKFEKIEYEITDDVAVLKDAIGYIVCEIIDKMETETHTIFLGRIIDGDILQGDTPMTYAYYHKVKKGSSPKTAPTYVEEKVNSELCYRCTICNYIYEGDITKEPDDYVCPICKKPKSVFVKC